MGSNTLSTLAWIYAYPTQKAVELITSYESTSGTSTFYLSLNNLFLQSNTMTLNFTILNNGNKYSSSGGIIRPYTWYLVSGIYNGNTLQTYVNGQEESTYLYSSTVTNSLSSFNLGGYSNGVSALSGEIADVSLYKTALNQSQLYLLYRLGMPVSSEIKLPIK